MTLTDTDKRILALLKINARTSTTRLAQELGVSRATITKRLALLEQNTILNYTINTTQPQESGVCAWTGLLVDGARLSAVARALRREPVCAQVYTTNGKWDFLLALEARDLAALDVGLDRIRQISGVRSSETNILLSTIKG